MKHHDEEQIKTPLWKWIVLLLVAVGMPLLFTFYRSGQIEQAAAETQTGIQVVN